MLGWGFFGVVEDDGEFWFTKNGKLLFFWLMEEGMMVIM